MIEGSKSDQWVYNESLVWRQFDVGLRSNRVICQQEILSSKKRLKLPFRLPLRLLSCINKKKNLKLKVTNTEKISPRVGPTSSKLGGQKRQIFVDYISNFAFYFTITYFSLMGHNNVNKIEDDLFRPGILEWDQCIR